MNAKAHHLKKVRVAASFTKAAATYDAAAHLQRAVGEHLWHMIDTSQVFKCGMDLGCGTGHFTGLLQGCAKKVIAVDLAQGMLHHARNKHFLSAHSEIAYVAADAEALPFTPASVDFIFSSLALQWCQNLPELAQSLGRVLASRGQLAIASLGPETLHELRAAWASIDKFVHVNRFESEASFLAPFLAANFRLEQAYSEHRRLHYSHLGAMLHELKALGVTNANQGQSQGLVGRRDFQRLALAYDKFRDKDGLPATYQVHYWLLRKQ